MTWQRHMLRLVLAAALLAHCICQTSVHAAGLRRSTSDDLEASNQDGAQVTTQQNGVGDTTPSNSLANDGEGGTTPANNPVDDGEGGTTPANNPVDDGEGGTTPANTLVDDGEGGTTPANNPVDDGEGGTTPANNPLDDREGGTTPVNNPVDDGEGGTTPANNPVDDGEDVSTAPAGSGELADPTPASSIDEDLPPDATPAPVPDAIDDGGEGPDDGVASAPAPAAPEGDFGEAAETGDLPDASPASSFDDDPPMDAAPAPMPVYADESDDGPIEESTPAPGALEDDFETTGDSTGDVLSPAAGEQNLPTDEQVESTPAPMPGDTVDDGTLSEDLGSAPAPDPAGNEEEELEQLRTENQQLRAQNDRLRRSSSTVQDGNEVGGSQSSVDSMQEGTVPSRAEDDMASTYQQDGSQRLDEEDEGLESFLEVSEQTSAIGEYKQISHASAGDSIAVTIMPEAAFDEVKVKFCCEALVFDVTPPKQAPPSRTTRDGLAAMADMEVDQQSQRFCFDPSLEPAKWELKISIKPGARGKKFLIRAAVDMAATTGLGQAPSEALDLEGMDEALFTDAARQIMVNVDK